MDSTATFDTDEENILCFLPFGYEYVISGEIRFKNEADFRCTVNIKNIHDEDDVKFSEIDDCARCLTYQTPTDPRDRARKLSGKDRSKSKVYSCTFAFRPGGPLMLDGLTEWIARLSESTLTTWRVQRTYPASGRCNVFKIAMKCQHNVNHKYKDLKNRKKHYLSKHTGCPSNMIITIKRYLKNSKSKRLKCSDPLLIDWPCFVYLNFAHNHPLNTSAVLRFRPLGNQIKDKIIALFKKGHTPSSALESIKLELFLDNDDDYFDMAEDGFYVPTHSQVKYLFAQTFGVSGVKDANCIQPGIEDLINNYNATNVEGRAEFGRIGEHVFVTICSPIMWRAHKLLPHSSQVAIIESTGSTEKRGHKIYFIVSPTPSGSIPLGCIITDGEGMEIMNAALQSLKKCFPPDNSFYSQTYPFVLMSDDEANEQQPLRSHWPKSVMLLCQCRVLKSAWKWLNCYQNVPKPLREEVYYAVKSLIYCQNEKDLCEIYTILVSKYHSNVPKLVTYVNNMWPGRTLWSSAYRLNIPIGGNSKLNYVEITFKIMKDCILQRIRQYNLTQLADFILVHYESYVRRRLLEFTEGKVSKKLLFKYIPPTSIINPSTIIQSEVDIGCYFVPSESDYSIKYMVDVKHCICSCEQGRMGKICKHLCGVISQMENSEIIDVPQNFKDMLYKIATGTDPNKAQLDLSLSEPPPSPLAEEMNNQTDSFSPSKSLSSCLTKKEQTQLLGFYKTINDGLINRSNLFVPAIKSMLKKIKHVKSETEFVKAIKTFGTYNNKSCCDCAKGVKRPITKKLKNINDTKKIVKKCLNESQYVPILPKIENEFILLYDPLAL